MKHFDSTPHPNPLPRGEGEPRFFSYKNLLPKGEGGPLAVGEGHKASPFMRYGLIPVRCPL